MADENKSGVNKKLVAVFEDQPVRRVWNEKEEKWYFSVVDIVRILTEQKNFQTARKYWNKLKERLNNEGNETVTNCHQLKMLAEDGKSRNTDVLDVERILRLVQSVPSPKAEPFKLWLARVGYERIQETIDPELAVSRGRKSWQVMGRSRKWIEQRMLGVEVRNKLTDYWTGHGIGKSEEFAKLTNVIHKEWSGLSVKAHKNLKNIDLQNLRDHMSEAEILFTALAELSSRHISEKERAEGYLENENAAMRGGRISGNARKALESETGKRVVSAENFLPTKNSLKKLK